MVKLYLLLGEIALALILGLGITYWIWKIRKTRILWDNAWWRINVAVVILVFKWAFAALGIFFVDVVVTWFGIIYEGLTVLAAVLLLLGFRKLYYDLINPYGNLFKRKEKIIAKLTTEDITDG